MHQSSLRNIYTEKAEQYSTVLKKLRKKRSYLGWTRLSVVLAILLIIYYLFFNSSIFVWVALFLTIALFLYVLSVDTDNNENIAEAERLLSINNEELSIMSGDFYNRPGGLAYLPEDHPYAADIDLFGRASIYQYINRCTSDQSKKLLATLLLNFSTKEEIQNRQQSAKALSEHLDWRQKFQSAGMADPLTFFTEEKIISWLRMEKIFQQPFFKIAPQLFTVITFATVALFVGSYISSQVFWLLAFVFFLIAKSASAKVSKTYTALSRIENEVNTIQKQLHLIESLPVTQGILNKNISLSSLEKKGSESITELKQILKRFDFRQNAMVFLVLNTFLLWDVRQTNSLNKWKDKNALLVPGWFSALANIEIINTLATLSFNHPDWIFPMISNVHFTLIGEQIGHPLIDNKKRVNNSLSVNGTARIAVITGSNMAGKSTFLRSIAVNLVLAQMGAPVCATAFTFSLVRLFSSMRIADNLAENTSTFYAELKKLKSIIDEVKKHEKVFILLDEILRGTNSLDRHTGSEALIKQLIREHAVAVIATHDVELANLQKEFESAISNYYFDVQVEGEELYFDYKLKRGVCQSLNASLLMKKIGIEM